VRPNREVLRSKIARQMRSARRLPRRLSHAAHVGLQIAYWMATFQLRAGLRSRRDARLIRNSGLFDPGYYLAQCPGDRAALSDPVQHYVRTGAARGLDPSPLFDGSAYAEQNPAAEASGENPLAHFIRSRKVAPAEARAPMRPSLTARFRAAPPLLARPFCASPSARSVLVFHSRIPRTDGDGRVVAMLKLLRDLGHPVTLASASAESSAEDVRRIRELGVEVVSGFDAALARLADEGHSYLAVFLSGAEQALRYMTAVRAYAPRATVVYDAAGASSLGGRDAELAGDRAPDGAAAVPDRIEQATAACADVVLVGLPRERDALLACVPGARVEVLPDVRASKERGVDGAEGVLVPLLKGGIELASGAAPIGPGELEPPVAEGASARSEAVAAPRTAVAGPSLARPGRSVLVVGVYLCGKRNNAVEIARELGRAEEWSVEQRWIALGKGEIPEALAPLTAWRQRSRVPKFVLLNRLLGELDVGRHEFVLVCDDDISLPDRFVDNYLDLVTRHDLALAQPARTHDSYTDHWIVERLDGLAARRTRFVEIGPLFSIRRDAARILTPFDEDSPMGWGYDFVWPVIVEQAGLRMGIVDATPVAHNMRKPVALYDMRDAAIAMNDYLESRPHLSLPEAFTIVEAYP
jgi:hypothetical protein